eukprot:1498078-Prymnesium_polylepis.1
MRTPRRSPRNRKPHSPLHQSVDVAAGLTGLPTPVQQVETPVSDLGSYHLLRSTPAAEAAGSATPVAGDRSTAPPLRLQQEVAELRLKQQISAASVSKKPAPPPAVAEVWALKEEATRLFKLADADNSGFLDLNELRTTLRSGKEDLAATVMNNIDTNRDRRISLEEWLVAQKDTFDKSEAGLRVALGMMEKAIKANREAAASEGVAVSLMQPTKSDTPK